MIFRFVSGIILGVPAAFIAYYVLPLLASDITVNHILLIGFGVGLFGALQPGLMMKWIALGYMWNRM